MFTDTHLAEVSDEVEAGVDEPLKVGDDMLEPLFVRQHVVEGVEPGPQQRSPSQRCGLQVHHAAPADRGRLAGEDRKV